MKKITVLVEDRNGRTLKSVTTAHAEHAGRSRRYVLRREVDAR